MPKKTFREKISQQEKEPVSLNNFYCYLPGGPYREFYESSPKKARIMDAMDMLLRNEFSDLDPQKIIAPHIEAQYVVEEMFDFSVQRTEEESSALEQRLDDLKLAGRESDDKIRPLYDRLIKMGFNDADLTR